MVGWEHLSARDTEQSLLSPSIMRPELSEVATDQEVKAIGLADSSNIFAAVDGLQPRSIDRLAKSNLGFIRDVSMEARLSFADAFST